MKASSQQRIDDELRSVAQRFIDRRQRETNRWEGIVRQYAEKVNKEPTSYAYDQLGVAVYELHSSKFLLSELKRVQQQLALSAPAKPYKGTTQLSQLSA